MRTRFVLAIACAAWLASGVQAQYKISILTGANAPMPCTPGASAANCALCQSICRGVIQCLTPSDTLTLGGQGSNVFALIASGATNQCKATPFEVTISKPTTLASSPSSAATPGQFVVAQQSAAFRINAPPVTRINANYAIVDGTLVARCDGFSMYFGPGGWCNCQADFSITDFGTQTDFMGVASGQDDFNDQKSTPLGTIYATRVKQNLSPADFLACNSTFMGAHNEYDDKGRPFPVQCARSFVVQQSRVSFYNVSYCGTQYSLFNQARDAFQNETSCRDGLGVVSSVQLNNGSGIVTQSQISSPAGVFFHRWFQNQSVAFPPVNGTPDDSEWFFKLKPAVLPLNASTQLDMELTLLNGVTANRTQLTCIAEFQVLPYTDTATGQVYNGPILGFTPQAKPNSARALTFAAALLLPALLLLLL